jgi:hypothetical protein
MMDFAGHVTVTNTVDLELLNAPNVPLVEKPMLGLLRSMIAKTKMIPVTLDNINQTMGNAVNVKVTNTVDLELLNAPNVPKERHLPLGLISAPTVISQSLK